MAAGIVISAQDLDRIKVSLGTSTTGGASASQQRERSETLHAKSQARAKTWSNTLEGSRRKKAEEKKKKFEKEELERQMIDAEEAKIQLDQRKATIDRANKLLYDESDRMKSFHSKMMLCDVLAEREAQTALKEELKKLEHIREDRYLEMDKQNYRKMLEREMREKETREELQRQAAKGQKEQLAQFKDKRFREIEDEMLEGELLRRKAIEDLEAERQAQTRKRGAAIRALEETQKANDYLKQIKTEDSLRQLREEEKIAEYAERKERLLMLRRHKEDEVFHQKQATRNAIIEAQAKRLEEMQCNEDARIEAQVQQKSAADEKKHKDKIALQRRFEEDMMKSRAAQIQRKRNDREREKAEDAATANFMQQWCKVLDQQETEEQQLKLAAAKKLADEHKKMTEISRRSKFGDKDQERLVATRAMKAMEADTLEFHNYAESCIRSYAEEGKNVIPLIKELRDYRKRVLE